MTQVVFLDRAEDTASVDLGMGWVSFACMHLLCIFDPYFKQKMGLICINIVSSISRTNRVHRSGRLRQ